MSPQNKNSTERELVGIFESVIPHRIILTLGSWETKNGSRCMQHSVLCSGTVPHSSVWSVVTTNF